MYSEKFKKFIFVVKKGNLAKVEMQMQGGYYGCAIKVEQGRFNF